LGTAAANGTVSYAPLTLAGYNDLSGNYIIPYNTYAQVSNVLTTDKTAEKLVKYYHIP
jgi:hypothetical protein